MSKGRLIPKGLDTTCRVCGDETLERQKIAIGHKNGKTFQYCRLCVTDPFRAICGRCGKILWYGNTVMLDDGTYCSVCKPDEPLYEGPATAGEIERLPKGERSKPA